VRSVLARWSSRRTMVTHHWSTHDTSSVDRLPYVGRLPNAGDNVWVATGFSAWGMTGGTMAGTLLAICCKGA
jgi:glycine/D-amino acid oxidase-like deaminating enzyme